MDQVVLYQLLGREVFPEEAQIRNSFPNTCLKARSSGVEHYLDTVGVSGSNPLEPIVFGTRQLFDVSSGSVADHSQVAVEVQISI